MEEQGPSEAQVQAAVQAFLADGWKLDVQELTDSMRKALVAAAGVKDTHAAEPVGEIVLFGGDLKEVSWRKGKMPAPGTKLYAHPPAGVTPCDGSQR
jgi:hypothetical protein